MSARHTRSGALGEQRGDARRAVRVNAVLYCDALPILRGRVLDMGPRGAFVRTGPSAFGPGADLELELILPGGTGIRTCRLPVTVRHVTGSGLGLRFRRVDPVLTSWLEGLTERDGLRQGHGPAIRDH